MSKAAQTEQVGAFELDGADVALLFGVDWSSVVPSEIRLFGNGMTATKKGDFLFDEEAALSVMDRFREQGMDRLPFDIAHGMLNPAAPPDAHRSLGWFVPEIRDDIEGGGGVALFAADIEWTETGMEALKKREFRFFSPAITFNADTRRITGLINVALTNIPATKNQRPLVLDGLEADENNNNEESMKVLLDTLGAPDETGAVAKVGEMQAQLSAISEACGVPADKAAEKIAELSQTAIKAVAELENIKAEKAAAEKAAKLDALCAEGKLPPAQKEFAASLSESQLDQFVATLANVSITRKVEEPAEHSKVETLSAEEKEACRLLGLSEADMLEEKALAAKENS